MKIAVVLCFENLPVGALSCYGETSAATPSVDSFAANSVLFDSHFAETGNATVTQRAWQTGQFQFPLSENEKSERVDLLLATFARHEVGFRFISEDKTDSLSGLAHETLEQLASHCRDRDEPIVFWLRAKGDSEADTIDDVFGRLWQGIESACTTGRHELLFILTAAMGTAVDPASGVSLPLHRLGECFIHTPLVIFATDGEAGTRRSALAQPVDVLPTLCDWFEISEQTLNCDGNSLMPMVRGSVEQFDAPHRRFAYVGDGRGAIGIRTNAFYLVAESIASLSEETTGDGSPAQLFVKPEDIWEVHDVAGQNPEVVEELSRELLKFVEEGRPG